MITIYTLDDSLTVQSIAKQLRQRKNIHVKTLLVDIPSLSKHASETIIGIKKSLIKSFPNVKKLNLFCRGVSVPEDDIDETIFKIKSAFTDLPVQISKVAKNFDIFSHKNWRG